MLSVVSEASSVRMKKAIGSRTFKSYEIMIYEGLSGYSGSVLMIRTFLGY